MRDKAPKAANWKASQSLNIKPRPSNAWELSYNEADGKTYLSYFVDITNGQSTVAPQNVRVDVYDPAYEKKGTIRPLLAPTVSRDGTFSYWLRGEVEVESAGDYHFVCEAQQADADSEGKDRGKWGLEQNSSARFSPYVAFGSNSPALALGGIRYGTKLEFAQGVEALVPGLYKMGYRKSFPPTRAWWMQNFTGQYGVTPGGYSVAQVLGVNIGETLLNTDGSLNISRVRQQTAQYNAIWAYFGHGFGGRTMAFWSGSQTTSNREEFGPEDEPWTYLLARETDKSMLPPAVANDHDRWRSLDTLPLTWQRRKVTGPIYFRNTQRLNYARAMLFVGCETGANSSIGRDLPTRAVAEGAQVALGFTTSVEASQIAAFMRDFTDALDDGKTFQEAVDDAASNVDDGTGRVCQVAGNGTIRLDPAAWGDNVGPDR